MVSLDPEGLNVEVGDQVLVAGQKNGTVRFYGKTDFAPGGSWVHPLTTWSTVKPFDHLEPPRELIHLSVCRLLVWHRAGSADGETRRLRVWSALLQLPAQIRSVCTTFPCPEVCFTTCLTVWLHFV